MKRATGYLLLWIAALLAIFVWRDYFFELLRVKGSSIAQEGLFCVLSGAIGAIVYCIRAVYEAAAVRKAWDDSWLIWYFWRPFAGAITGFASWIFLKGGIIGFSGGEIAASNTFALAAVAFLCGLNVKNALRLLENEGKKRIGIEPSRQATGESTEVTE